MIVTALAIAVALQKGVTGPRRAQSVVPLTSLFSDEDYPLEALRRGAQGVVRFRLSISARGRPTACTIEESSGDASLDQTTCTLALARARFHPARNDRGVAVADEAVARVRWAVPPSPYYIGLEPVRVVNIQMIEPTGHISCSVTYNDLPLPPEQYRDCRQLAPDELRSTVARLNGRTAQLSQVHIYAPDGTTPPALSDQHLGQRSYQFEMRLLVEPDARVANCQVVQQIIENDQSRPALADPCDYYRTSGTEIFETMPLTTRARTIRVTQTGYVRLTPS